MAIDFRIGTKINKSLRTDLAPATNISPFPYIGIVKNNLDPTRCGRVQVFIPELGGNPDDPANWRTISYASPFMGYTSTEINQTDVQDNKESFTNVSHTYGMWMVPPDIGVEVICMFIAGDPMRGYWVACVNSNLSHHMVPALAGSTNIDVGTASRSDQLTFVGGLPIPVVEFNENNENLFLNSSFYNNPKPVHTYQYGILKTQGLDRDPIRGAISSSSQRETPSHVFGISTPGRPIDDPADDKANYVSDLNADILNQKYQKIKTRKGGHSFVMDDGAVLGQDQLVRLRSAKGHQVLLHDSTNNLYIAHADGSSWIELTNEGAIKIFTKGGFALRSEGSINLHSDGSINFNAVNNIKFKAGNKIQMESVGTEILTSTLAVDATGKIELRSGGAFNQEAKASMSLKAEAKLVLNGSTISQNSDPAAETIGVKELPMTEFPDSVFDSMLGVYINKSKAITSIVTVLPTHEPYFRGNPPAFFQPETSQITPQASYTGAVDAIKNVSGTAVRAPAGDKELRVQPQPKGTVGNLSKDQLTALYAQIGKSESGGDYTITNSRGYLGKYQVGYQAMIDQGYIKSTVTSNDQMNNPNSWTGKDGITSKTDFLSNPTVQESAMESITKTNYSRLVSSGAITADMPPENVGGMLSVAHLLGAGGANTWRKGGGGADANGTTGDDYFQRGKYAVGQLGPKMPAINAG